MDRLWAQTRTAAKCSCALGHRRCADVALATGCWTGTPPPRYHNEPPSQRPAAATPNLVPRPGSRPAGVSASLADGPPGGTRPGHRFRRGRDRALPHRSPMLRTSGTWPGRRPVTARPAWVTRKPRGSGPLRRHTLRFLFTGRPAGIRSRYPTDLPTVTPAGRAGVGMGRSRARERVRQPAHVPRSFPFRRKKQKGSLRTGVHPPPPSGLVPVSSTRPIPKWFHRHEAAARGPTWRGPAAPFSVTAADAFSGTR